MTPETEAGRTVPVARELALDGAGPVDVLRRMRFTEEECFLLESVEGRETTARYTFLGMAPSARLTSIDGAVAVETGGRVHRSELPFLPALEALAVEERYDPDPALPPLCAGAVGYLAYDAVRSFEDVPDRHPREGGMPDALFLRFDSILSFDRARGRVLATSTSKSDDGAAATARLDRLEEVVCGRIPPAIPAVPTGGPPDRADAFAPTMRREAFLAAVEAAKEAILDGEIYQVVLSQRWTARLDIDPLDVYECLRALNPSPYLFYLHTREAAVFGASPEMLVRCRGRAVETRPIAGTIGRGGTPEEDARLAERLLEDPKERAEHVMLVDLGRNDLGRVCEIGSVKVARYAEVEKYSHVQHLVSDVRGTLAAGKTAADALASCFPAGTLTGAPKIRAMELIDELETTRRGVYGGAVGYLDAGGNLDTAIAIRTAVVEEGVCRIQAGAGIVADSVPENEYREAESKAEALFRAVDVASKLGPESP